MEPTTALTATADAANVINAVAGASTVGFAQIICFMLLLGAFAWMWVVHKDRQKTKSKRDDWMEQHEKLHQAEKDHLNERLKSYDDKLDRMQASMKDFGVRLGSIEGQLRELIGSINTYFKLQKL